MEHWKTKDCQKRAYKVERCDIIQCGQQDGRLWRTWINHEYRKSIYLLFCELGWKIVVMNHTAEYDMDKTSVSTVDLLSEKEAYNDDLQEYTDA